VSNPEYAGRDLEAMDFAQRYHRWILDEFRPFLGKTIAEVGAGSGGFSELLLNEPIERLVAIEPSARMLGILERRLGSDERLVTERAILAEVAEAYTGKVDTLVYVNVLEHIQDDRAELSLAHGTLRPGGHVCIFVPALPWLYSEFDRSIGHHRRYWKEELIGKVGAAGFEVRKARYFDFAGVLPWFVVYRLLGRTLASGHVQHYDRYVVPVMRRLEGAITPPIGKNVLLVARKPVH